MFTPSSDSPDKTFYLIKAMCRLTYSHGRLGATMTPLPWEQDPRPPPRLTWAVPLDPVDLVSSIEAYANTLEIFHAVRLCHRVGNSALSTLPQELLELILAGLYRDEKSARMQQWSTLYTCFVAKCEPVEDHLFADSIDTHGRWADYLEEEYMDPWSANYRERTAEERVADLKDDLTLPDGQSELMGEYMESMTYDDSLHRTHQNKWLSRMCLCPSIIKEKSRAVHTFFPLNNVRSHYA